MNRYGSVAAAVLLSIFVLVPQQRVYALGTGALGNQLGVSARVSGMGYAFAGVADDPSAIFFNPAGLTQVKGWQAELGAAFLHLDAEHTSPDGTKDKMDNGWPTIPYFYLSHSGESSPWAFGIGVNSPFGLMTNWKDDSYAKYYATDSRLLLYMVNPTVSYAVNDKISFGAGVDYVNIYDVSLKRKLVPLGLGEAPGDANLSGDGDGWGYNLAVHWKPVEKHSFGLSYRSQVNVPVDGTAELTNVPASYIIGNSYKTNLRTEFKIPQNVLFGYGYHPNDRWIITADYQWTGWNANDKTHIDYDQGISAVLPTDISRDWRNSNSIGAGAEFKANERWDLRFGGLVYERVIPSSTLEASLPDSSRWMLSAGTGYHIANTRIDFALGAVVLNNRTVDNNQEGAFYSQDGTYKSIAPFFTIGLKQKWGSNK